MRDAAFDKALAAGVLAVPLFAAVHSASGPTGYPIAVFQLAGAGFLAVFVLAHVAEAEHLVPSMGWGQPHSIGRYIDLTSAVSGASLLGGDHNQSHSSSV